MVISKACFLFGIMIVFNINLAFSQKKWQFDFGNGATMDGFVPVGIKTIYSDSLGYGFESSPNLSTHTIRKVKDPITSDYITSSNPFFFSVLVPEGNYDVEVVLGDKSGSSETVVRAECRRSMTDLVVTKKGEISILKFTVHVRDTIIRNNGVATG